MMEYLLMVYAKLMLILLITDGLALAILFLLVLNYGFLWIDGGLFDKIEKERTWKLIKIFSGIVGVLTLILVLIP